MRRRRSTGSESNEEEEEASPSRRGGNLAKRKRVPVAEDNCEGNARENLRLIELKKTEKKKKKKRKNKNESEPKAEAEAEAEAEGEAVDSESETDEHDDLARSMGEVVRVLGTGKEKRNHYKSFEYDGFQYHLEDPVLLVPQKKNQKPCVAIVKDIYQTFDGAIMVATHRLYRPEEAVKDGGGYWPSRNMREVFYSFRRTEVPAESVMHKCVLHFIPSDKQIPPRKQLPGFVFQKVYDTERQMVYKLTDQDHEIYSKFLVRD
ncbi:ASI1-immunoprecipitated protein 3-like isoform X1 [Primulina huaijiensis]|uniref:ASI1-immunoprecipitated protein 3-like isoform X1 n=1 Tax=Primulina huaijiensis TaxID=1492673 RepID=UPI003CC73608